MEKQVREIIDLGKSIVSRYSSDNISDEKFIDNYNVIYYRATCWGDDDNRDLGLYIEYYKFSGKINPAICLTRKYNLYETINLDSVIQALTELKNL